MDVSSYLDAVTGRARSELGKELTAVLLVGSAGAGWFEAEVSDLDVAVVVKRPLEADRPRSLGAALSHSRLPCPARKLELVVYSRAALANPGPTVAFELNLNTGGGAPDHVGLDPGAEAAHWFLLDLSIARERSTPLYGPPLRSLLGEIPRPLVIDALRAALTGTRPESRTLFPRSSRPAARGTTPRRASGPPSATPRSGPRAGFPTPDRCTER